MSYISNPTFLSLREGFHDKSMVFSVFGLGFLFAAFIRALVGTVTFQTGQEIGFLIMACIVLFLALQMLCVVGSSAMQTFVIPISMTIGAVFDVVFGMFFGRASTVLVTLVFSILGFVTVGLLYIKHFNADNKQWRGQRESGSYALLAFPLIYLAIFLLVLGSVFGCLFMLHVGGLNRGVSQLGFFTGCMLSGVVIIGLALFYSERYMEILAKVTLLFTIAGLSLILMFQPSFVSLLVFAIGFCCFFHIAYCMVFNYYRQFSFPLLFPTGYLLFLFLSILAGLFMGKLFSLSGSIESLDAFTVASMLLINAISVLGLGSNHIWNVQGLSSAKNRLLPQRDTEVPSFWKAAVREVAEEAHLTRREEEVFALISKGRNASFIEKSLFISNHTARAHILRIYKKLNLHSQQAIIDYVEMKVSEKKDAVRI